MIIACLGAVVAAVLLALPAPAARTIPTRLSRDGRVSGPRPRRGCGVLGAAGAVVGSGLFGAWIDGAAGAVVGLAAGSALVTTARLLVLRRGRRQAARRRLEVARGCAAIASQVRVGRVPGEALAAAASDWPVLEPARQASRLGADVPETLLAHAGRPGCAGLAALARAWRLAQETGAPMAASLDQVALALRRDEALQRTVAAELAGPRATGKVMAVLPLGGIGMGYLLGGQPLQFLVAGPPGWACLVGGVLLACAGVLWVDRLARVAEEA